MHDTAPVLWLQQWASPALTEFMLAVSALGYVSSCLALAIVCGFGWRPRLGVTLILAIVFANAMTIVAKGALASPRPHAVDTRVRTPAFESHLATMAARTAGPAENFGFPSGHVAATTAWALGLALFRRRPWQIGAAAIWIALMALSRMYLGRHFPVDVAGGLVAGAAGLAVARLEVPPAPPGIGTRSARARAALGISVLAVVAFTTLAGAGLGAHDAGRFCGLLGAVLLLKRTRTLGNAGTRLTRVARVAAALFLLAVALWSSTWTIATGTALGRLSAMLVSAGLYASVLLVPALALGRQRG
jgi:membrane-associated phospholipid phosphatase